VLWYNYVAFENRFKKKCVLKQTQKQKDDSSSVANYMTEIGGVVFWWGHAFCWVHNNYYRASLQSYYL